ncbi:hypothetical protein EYC84_005679 [Monilinia fructicola]|uniref:Uncharacterized protein n=1 Tax=Monilinia fructicola TaxID=38448 RepID=A0A5M9JX79_MONFR|nr:hypothetical protein EYC84_005679 [Monilinia fructicola]
MAAAPREGQAWFLKSSLKSPGYDGSKSEDFYQWMLLEVVYNDTEDEAYAVAPPLKYPNHPRTGEQHFYGDAFSTGYGRYQYMTAMYGPSAEDIKRTFRIQSQISRGQLKRQTGSAAVCYVAVPMPTTKERFIWIDLTYPIRAFYIPSAFTAHPQYKGHAIFSRLVVRGRKGLPTAYTIKGLVSRDIAACQKVIDDWNAVQPHNFKWRKQRNRIASAQKKVLARIKETGPEGPALKEPGLTPGYLKPDGKPPSQMYAKVSYDNEAIGDDTWGWGLRPQWTVRIDVFTLACQLLIPYSRRTDEYRDPYICFALFDRRVVQQSKILADIDMARAIDLAQAQSREEGVRLQYVKDEPDDKFIKDLIVGFIAVGLGFIPVVGPLVAFAWSVGYEVLTDTDKFTKAAGIGGKAPAFTQAAVDSREKMLPMIKMAAKSVFKLHQEEGDKTSIRVDTEGDSKADDNSQQESKKAEGGEEPQQQPEDNKGNDETPQPPTQTRSASENGRDDLKNNEDTQPQREERQS